MSSVKTMLQERRNQLKVGFAVLFIFFASVYWLMPFFSTSWEYEFVTEGMYAWGINEYLRVIAPTNAPQVSLGGYAWGVNDYAHIANYIARHNRHTFAISGLNRDILMLGVGVPVAGLVLVILLLILKTDKWLPLITGLLTLWALFGGIMFMSDPLLNLGGAAWVMMFVSLYLMAALAGLYLFLMIKKMRKSAE